MIIHLESCWLQRKEGIIIYLTILPFLCDSNCPAYKPLAEFSGPKCNIMWKVWPREIGHTGRKQTGQTESFIFLLVHSSFLLLASAKHPVPENLPSLCPEPLVSSLGSVIPWWPSHMQSFQPWETPRPLPGRQLEWRISDHIRQCEWMFSLVITGLMQLPYKMSCAHLLYIKSTGCCVYSYLYQNGTWPQSPNTSIVSKRAVGLNSSLFHLFFLFFSL